MIETATQFSIIRHAPTLWNENKRIQGQQDSALSIEGEKMAAHWGHQLGEFNFDHLLASDLGRVSATAKCINSSLKLPIEVDARLREQDWGKWTGMTIQEIKSRDRELLKNQEKRGWDFRPVGGESRQEVLIRSRQALAEAHSTWSGKNILVVCHEGVIKCLLYHLLGRRFLPEEPQVIKPYNLHQVTMQNDTLTLTHINLLTLTSPE